MSVSKFDVVYRSILLEKFFTKGWGKPECYRRLFEFRKLVCNRGTCQHLVSRNHPVVVDKDEEYSDYRLLEGHFTSPFHYHLPGLLPPEAETAYFQLILPKRWKTKHRPVCINLAGTGDHYFWRRRKLMAQPLIREAGIGSLLLENPYYGLRKPKEQVRSSLCNVSDIFVMGGSLVLESLALLHWCERQGYGPLGITGISMGGHMASLAATNWHKPLVLVPCLSWSTASGVFTQGVMSSSINWQLLEDQFFTDDIYRQEILKMVKIVDDEAFQAGQQFAKHYPKSLDQLERKQYEAPASPVSNTTELNKPTAEKKAKTSSRLKSLLIASQVLRTFNESKSQLMAKLPTETPRLAFLSDSQASSLMAAVVKATSSFGPSSLPGSRQSNSANQEQALQFMRGIMDECTHLRNFSIPVDTELIIIVSAKDDGYVPRDGYTDLRDLWPGSEVRYVDAGHVMAFLLYQATFRKAISDAFDRMTKKYYE